MVTVVHGPVPVTAHRIPATCSFTAKKAAEGAQVSASGELLPEINIHNTLRYVVMY